MNRHSLRADEWMQLALDRYLDMVYRLAHARTGSIQDAEDISQEVMLRLMANASKIESEAHLKAWLIRVTVNMSTNLFRSAWRRRSRPLEHVPEAPVQRENSRLDAALMQLRPEQRVAVHLYYYEEMTAAEIAETLGISAAAVKMRLSRARKQLKEALDGKGGDALV